MKNPFISLQWRTVLSCGCILLALLGGIAQAAPLGTTFTYQGRLTDGGIPATGSYDMDFALYDAGTAGTLVGASPTVIPAPVGVINGLFTVTLDFGGTFASRARWLEIVVRPNGSTAAYTVLSPRQPLTPAPQAIYALTAGTTASATSVPWGGLTGVPSGFADGIDNNAIYSAGDGLTLIGTAFSIPPLAILNPMLADNAVSMAKLANGSVTGAKIPSGQVVKSINAFKDDVVLIAGDNIALSTVGNTVSIAASPC